VPERSDEERRLGLTREEVEARRAEFQRRARIARRFEANTPRPALWKLRAAHDWLWLNCETPGCGHYVALPLAPLIIRWGADASSELLRRGFRCTRCGGRRTSIRFPSWGGNQIGWMTIDTGRQWTGEAVWPEPLSMHYLADKTSGHNGEFEFHPVLGSLRLDLMCNLYSQTRSHDEIRGLFRIPDNRAYSFEPLPAIFPRTVAPIVRIASDGER
jgi:hypothetical protein